jgi:hypothetical protein
MNHNKLLYLAARIRRGDSGAALLLRKLLEPLLIYMVRFTLRYDLSVNQALTQRILAEASRQEHNADQPTEDDREAFFGRVAQALCERIIDGLRAGSRESVRLIETVCS